MSNSDNFDTEIEQADAEFEEQQAAPAPVKKKKSGNGFLFFILFLLAAGGGGFYALKTSMIKLPFAIPGVTSVAQQVPAADPALASADPAAVTAPAVDANAAPVADPALAGTTGELPVPAAGGILPPAITDEVVSDGIIAPSNPDMAEDPFAPAASSAMPTDTSAAMPTDPSAAPANDPAMVAGDMPADPFAAAPTMDTPAQGTDLSAQGADPFAAPVETAPAATTPEAAAPVAAVSDPFATSPAATPVAAPVVATTPSATTADAQVYEARIATLEQKIETLEAALTNLQESQVTKADIEGLKNSITVAATDKAPVKTKAPKNDEALGAAKNEVENYRHGIMPGVVKAKRPASDEAYSPSKAAAAQATAPVNPASLTTNTAWVLKSAKPGTAWVAERGSNEMKTITVGDTVRGIGKVTSVVKDSNGKWVVTGTKGKISQ